MMDDIQRAIENLSTSGLEISGKARRVAEFYDALDTAISAMRKLQQIKSATNQPGKKMILDEAIAHAKEIANTKYAEGLSMLCHANTSDEELDGCIECAREHKQLAEWLTELQRYKQIGTVKECQEAMTKQSIVHSVNTATEITAAKWRKIADAIERGLKEGSGGDKE